MKLKCIGGECDGKIIEVADYFVRHDSVRVSGSIEFKLDTFEEDLKAFREGRVSKHSIMEYYIYRIEEFHFSEGKPIKFLIPEKWSVRDAVRYQFLK